VQVAQDRSRDAEFTKRFRILLAGVLIAGILAAAAIAVTVTRRGLRPLAAMKSSVQRIGRRISTSESRLPDGRANCSRSQSPSIRC
jgi:orotate phosphoribosyltransferase